MDKRILILSDSLALPRSKPEHCAHSYTWPELLKQCGYAVHQVSIGGAISSDLLFQVSYHKEFKPDIVIVQVGIVDCAPRFMTKFELSIARKIGVLGRILIKLLNNKIVKSIRRINYVKPKEFFNNIQKIQQSFDAIPVYFIGILNAKEGYERILPGVSSRIVQYNKLLSQQKFYISVEDFDDNGIMTDYHHLNEHGHVQIKDRILKVLNA